MDHYRHHTESTTTADSGQEKVASSPNAPGSLRLALPDAHDAPELRLAVAPDGQTLATTSHDNSARVWRIRRNGNSLALESLRRFDRHSDSVHAVDFSPDGRWLATAGYDGQVGLLDLETGENELSPVDKIESVVAVEFTPDGNALVTANDGERRIAIWQRDGLRLTNGCTLARLSDLPLWASLSPDGRRLAVVVRDQFVSLYDLDLATGATDAEPRRLVGHESTVYRCRLRSERPPARHRQRRYGSAIFLLFKNFRQERRTHNDSRIIR